MPRTLAQIDADIASLQALPPGVQAVSFEGGSTSFSTEQQKATAMARLTAERAGAVAAAAGTIRRRHIRLCSTKGL